MKPKIVYFTLISIIIIFTLFNFPKKVYGNHNSNNESIQDSILLKINSRGWDLFSSNNINEISFFISKFPNNESVEFLKKRRKKLFKSRVNVINAGINVDSLLKINPCYTPVYKNIDRTKSKVFVFSDLINNDLPLNNPYRNRFLVADLNTVDKFQLTLGLKEVFPITDAGWEFSSLFNYLKKHDITSQNISSVPLDRLDSLISSKTELKLQLKTYINFLDKVKAYETIPIKKSRSIINGKQIVTGQNICLCEVKGDSINWVGRFATSARGKSRRSIIDTVETNPKRYSYFEAMPTGKDSKYYAPLYRITSKNWETQRKYEIIDKFRDSLLGGGNSRVTHFDGRVQLPNFLLMAPDSLYPRAMRRNGIHESSLSIVSKCMLGSPQSLGCLRMSDYTSKFLRWWVPQNTKLFIYIDEDRYSNKSFDNSLSLMPFRNIKEGNVFRKWINKYHSSFAKKLDLDKDGSCNNCYVFQAWTIYKDSFLASKEGALFKNRKVEITINKENHL